MAKPAKLSEKKTTAVTSNSAKFRNTHKAVTDKPLSNSPQTLFPIVGIGASAGGLEALEIFMDHVSPTSGFAYVIVQHLDPTHKSMMPELIQRATVMKVLQAKNNLRVKPNHVYVIPPNTDLSILHGVFHLMDPIEPRGLRLPIDYFLRALATDQRQNSIAVILSGMGSDGTQGAKAIKEHAGLVLAQEPKSAKFDSMPNSVIGAGLADIIARAEELPQAITNIFRHSLSGIPMANVRESEQQIGDLDQVFILLRSHTGHDFSLYKKSTLNRRIERRMSLHQFSNTSVYAHYLQENPQEIDLLFKELLIGVTSFFRDSENWNYLQQQVLLDYMQDYPGEKPMRAWVSGCSTGEEAYSLAMLFKEIYAQIDTIPHFTLQIFATDLDSDAIEIARRGHYPASICADVSADRLARFFIKEGDGYRVNKEIRDMVIFAPQNVIMDPPFTKIDILTCRNMLIYLGSELQNKLYPLFHYCLNPGGILFLGSAESASNYPDLFTSSEPKLKIYQRVALPVRAGEVNFPSRTAQAQSAVFHEPKALPAPINLQTLADSVLLQQFSPAAVMVNKQGDILYISGRTGKYLEPAAGKANWNIHVMAREGLREALSLLMPRALSELTELTQKGLQIGSHDDPMMIDLSLQAIKSPNALNGNVMIVFKDVDAPYKELTRKRLTKKGREAELSISLTQALQEIQTIREERQTQQEELKSINEELQSTNEELQSTNEELTTSKEEMQSLNEELQTVNIELQSKIDDLSITSNDLKNLLDSTDIATIFLSNSLEVRRFTPMAVEIFKLIGSDIGRPLSDLVTSLDYPDLQTDMQDVLRTLVFSDKQIRSKDKDWYSVKIMPYRTSDNVIDGVVLTFMNISAVKRTEAALRVSEQDYREIFNSSTEAMFIYNEQTGRILDVNQSMLQLYEFDSKEEALVNTIGVLRAGESRLTEKEAKTVLTQGLAEGQQSFEWLARKNNGDCFWQHLSVCHINIGGVIRILASVRDITERKVVDDALAELRQLFTKQKAELESANVLHQVLNKTQAILEKRFVEQSADLKQSRTDLRKSRTDLKIEKSKS